MKALRKIQHQDTDKKSPKALSASESNFWEYFHLFQCQANMNCMECVQEIMKTIEKWSTDIFA